MEVTNRIKVKRIDQHGAHYYMIGRYCEDTVSRVHARAAREGMQPVFEIPVEDDARRALESVGVVVDGARYGVGEAS